ncbi:hypothetical protein WH50_04850 [Pokkaliibacter plantistimulans]|uniref:TonB-dependent receptor n=1 Tax=Pokkaliibacter plantistimulans TaxID=1635171 RepID=A0ABX5M378_9GAMM|nr:TonB-dependent receptor [Pokkaliibacter plantistimulans]PXF32420.1 hypothetical protein WH50_04850 [Pokkaliibacter plantistimulans]
MMLFPRPSLIALAVLAAHTSVHADTLQLDTLSVQADVEASSTVKSAAGDDSQALTVNAVDQNKIEAIQPRNLSDAIDTLPGIQQAGTNNSDYVSRGFALTRDNMKMDGMNAWVLKDQQIPLILVDRVEVLKGVGSMYYGSQEPGGVVNIITKKPQAESYHEINVEGGGWTSSSTGKGWGDKNVSFDSTGTISSHPSLLYRVVGEYVDSQGFRDDEKRSGYFFAPMLTWQIDDKQSLTAQVEVTRYHYNYQSGLVAPGADIHRIAAITTNYLGPQNYATDEGIAASLSYERELAAGWKNVTKWRSVWHKDERENFDISSVSDDASPTVARYYRHLYNQQKNHSLDSYFTGEVTTGQLLHRLTLGGTYAYTQNDFNRLAWGSADNALSLDVYQPAKSYIDTSSISSGAGSHRIYTYDTYSLYAQDVIGLTDRWDVQLGGRYDWQHREYESLAYTNAKGKYVAGSYTEADKDYFTPTLGTSYRLTDSIRLHTSYSESYETSAVDKTDVNGNNFEPETGKQYEVGLHVQPATNWNADLVLFNIEKRNVIVTDSDGDDAALGKVRSRGAELSLGWQPDQNWNLQASYTLLHTRVLEGDQDTSDSEEGNEFINSPHQQMVLQAQYRASSDLTLGALWLAQGRRYGSTDNQLVLPGYSRLDLTADYQIDKNTSVVLSVKNALDKQYYVSADSETAVYAGDPRYISARLKYVF